MSDSCINSDDYFEKHQVSALQITGSINLPTLPEKTSLENENIDTSCRKNLENPDSS